MKFATELCLSEVIFKGDSLRIIAAINSSEACHTMSGHIVKEIRCLRGRLVY